MLAMPMIIECVIIISVSANVASIILSNSHLLRVYITFVRCQFVAHSRVLSHCMTLSLSVYLCTSYMWCIIRNSGVVVYYCTCAENVSDRHKGSTMSFYNVDRWSVTLTSNEVELLFWLHLGRSKTTGTYTALPGCEWSNLADVSDISRTSTNDSIVATCVSVMTVKY